MYSLPSHKQQLTLVEKEVDAEIAHNPLGPEHISIS
jgi:hypothetical protein